MIDIIDHPLLDAYDYVDLKEGVADEREFSFRKCSEWVKNEAINSDTLKIQILLGIG